MGIKEIPTKEFLDYLESKGLLYERTKASHSSYNYPKGDPRRLRKPLIVKDAKQYLAQFHIQTILRTLGVSADDFNEWQKSQRKGYKPKGDTNKLSEPLIAYESMSTADRSLLSIEIHSSDFPENPADQG